MAFYFGIIVLQIVEVSKNHAIFLKFLKKAAGNKKIKKNLKILRFCKTTYASINRKRREGEWSKCNYFIYFNDTTTDEIRVSMILEREKAEEYSTSTS
ncbi:hypothetical protein SAMN02745975_00466 [Geosporobacter subterraneus DSM 17957]|uniref:Uncharacterized protein n=1 Tax=Geosporobacter subterraneus DSM 17957 TaxID=1121919 RepID=A0A1M6DI54_9FIRM|nr:hypothetical protein SAMN02745975_00466 [Geosporobacter subterraneus DSM 17957]